MREVILRGSLLALISLAACGGNDAAEEARECSPAPLLVCPDPLPPGKRPGDPGTCWEVILRCPAPAPEAGDGG